MSANLRSHALTGDFVQAALTPATLAPRIDSLEACQNGFVLQYPSASLRREMKFGREKRYWVCKVTDLIAVSRMPGAE